MKEKQTFSLRARGRSLLFAKEGLIKFFSSEHNAKIHLLATIVVIFFSLLLKVSSVEAIMLVFCIGSVWVAEIFNTAIEKALDFISSEKHPQIKFIKDLSAAAVLVSAIVAFIIGCIIFIPKL